MALLHFLLALALAPLLPGVINRVKARFAGRRGRPLLQAYFDLHKLLRKDAVYSHTSSWVFRAGPLISLAAVFAALCFLPLAGRKALLSFSGDFFLAAHLLAMARFAAIAAALDTGSAFEGMGASREATFSAITEPVFLLGLMPLGGLAGSYSLSAMLSPFPEADWSHDWPVLLLLAASFFIILLAENNRIPVDDPNTHLELTMIHEAMTLDHGGVDLACIEYCSALKLWFFCSVIIDVLLPGFDAPWLSLAAALGGVLVVAAAVGVVESCMARLRLVRVPQLLGLAGSFAVLACLICLH
jgi:formate hydrogenlyase subunit 4